MKKTNARGMQFRPSTEKRNWRTVRPALDSGNLKALLPVSALLLFICAMSSMYLMLSGGEKLSALIALLPAALLLYSVFRRKAPSVAVIRILVIAARVFLLAYALLSYLFFDPNHVAFALMITAFAAVPALFDTAPLESLLTVAPFFIAFLCCTDAALPTEQHAAEKLSAVVAFVVGQYVGHVKAAHAADAAEANLRLEAVNYYLYHADAPDPLTGLAGREQMFSQLDEVHAASLAGELYCSCFLTEVDGFQAYNSKYGKKAGDRLLVKLGELFASFENETGVAVGRIGAATFMAVWADISESRGQSLAEQLMLAVRKLAVPAGGDDACITVSIGLNVGLPSVDGSDTSYAYRLTEKALFYAKDGGGDRICRFDPETQSIRFELVPVAPEQQN